MADAELQAQVQQLQQLSQQLQAVTAQRQQFEAMQSETERAIESLEELDADTPVYRNVGSLLVKDQGKEAALTRLRDELETLEVRAKRVKSQEAELRQALEALQSKLQAAFAKQ